MRVRSAVIAFAFVGLLAACRSAGQTGDTPISSDVPRASTTTAVRRPVGTDPGGVGDGTPLAARPGDALAEFAGGCFWGTEDLFRQVPGVVATAVGFTGGHTTHPTYPEVCTHTTGHAETVLIEFDPKQVSYDKLLEIFFANHDPTTMNRQGPDVGDQYRSAVFTFDDAQAAAARAAIARTEQKLGKHVVTEVTPVSAFWKAEGYHQQYDEKTGTHSCPIGVPQQGT